MVYAFSSTPCYASCTLLGCKLESYYATSPVPLVSCLYYFKLRRSIDILSRFLKHSICYSSPSNVAFSLAPSSSLHISYIIANCHLPLHSCQRKLPALLLPWWNNWQSPAIYSLPSLFIPSLDWLSTWTCSIINNNLEFRIPISIIPTSLPTQPQPQASQPQKDPGLLCSYVWARPYGMCGLLVCQL